MVQTTHVCQHVFVVLPRPQLILAESGRPADEHPLPWDVRPLGLELRTVRHVPSQPTNLAVQALDAVLPPGADVAGLWRTAAVHISDALGPLPQNLPADLTDVQFFRASRIPPSGTRSICISARHPCILAAREHRSRPLRVQP